LPREIEGEEEIYIYTVKTANVWASPLLLGPKNTIAEH